MGDMLFELVAPPLAFCVERDSEADAVGRFSGIGLTIGLRGSSPVAAAASAQAAHDEQPERLMGWGATYFLGADMSKPAAVWVTRSDVASHRFAGAQLDPAADAGRHDPVQASI
jgi:hypothetical protein